jgi:hypothetical protein
MALRPLIQAWFALAAALFLCVTPVLLGPALSQQADRFLREEDIGLLAGLAMLIAASPLFWTLARRWAALAAWRPQPTGVAIGLACATALAAWLGVSLVFGGYPLSRDEDMAGFGAAILSHGQAWAPVASEWRAYVAGLEPEFVRVTAGGMWWQPAYLPVNAAMQALAGAIGAASWVNPVLAAISMIALFAVARRLWPDRPGLALAPVILLASSSQLLVTAMTSYAMTAHLAFNLVWLWLHLRGGRAGHAGALIVGFLATGLHQLVFHPLFAAPFVLQLWLDRRWATASLYTLTYGAICLFWLEFPSLTLAAVGGAVSAAAGVGGVGGQVSALVRAHHPPTVSTMAENLIRFVTWQSVLTAPLLVLGMVPAVRAGGAMRALVVGLVLTTAALIVLMPYQGYGWGYRYWHGLLGSIALIGTLGWSRLTDRLSPNDRNAASVLFAGAAVFSILALLPIRAAQARDLTRPYALAYAAIQRAPAQVVLVDARGAWYINDLVRNDPYLGARPLVMRARSLTPDLVRDLCSRHTVAVFDTAQAAAFGIRARLAAVSDSGPKRWAALGLAPRCGPAAAPVAVIDPSPGL